MTAPVELTTCPLCGPRGRHRPALGGTLRRCAACGFVWTAEVAAPPGQLYGESYYHGGGYEEYFLERPRRFEASRRLRWLLSVDRPASLLEAGSAGGFFVAAARRAGIAATGIDVSEVAARYARDHVGVSVHCGRFEEVSATVDPVEAVCAFHVLEHVEQPRAFLAAARSALVPGGLLALEVPNIASAAAGRMGVGWPGLQPRYHRWHFAPATLTALVRTSGFEIVGQDTTVFRYYMPARYRLRHVRRLLPPDWRGTGSPRLVHPHLGDLLRLVARRPYPGSRSC
ncbi:MAG TPA: class I SAM-dependent methyltransferase [Rugosimonospora sp.]|nr:class I SAM-dependent methyltransferase [Rugosimonospora sp.]